MQKQQEMWRGNSCLIYQPEKTAHVLRYILYFRYPLLTCTVYRCLLKTRESSPVKIIRPNEPWHFPKCSVFDSGFVHGVLRTHKSSRYKPRTTVSFISPHVKGALWSSLGTYMPSSIWWKSLMTWLSVQFSWLFL